MEEKLKMKDKDLQKELFDVLKAVDSARAKFFCLMLNTIESRIARHEKEFHSGDSKKEALVNDE